LLGKKGYVVVVVVVASIIPPDATLVGDTGLNRTVHLDW